jgi:hypothetical protein
MGVGKPRSRLSPHLSVLKGLARLVRPPWRTAVVTVLIAVAVGGALAAAWQRWGRAALQERKFRLTEASFEATPPPSWISSPVIAEVIRDGCLAGMPVHDPALVQRVAEAFALHPWVARVVRVEKRYPARVIVQLEYRRPVAVVPVATRGESGLLLVDAQGVLLPTHDFVSSQARDYLRIEGIDTLPAGVYGTPWGSRRVSEAASIAAAIGPRWKELGLYAIVPVASADGGDTYELRTPQGVRVVWGRPPGQEAPGEPPAAAKLAALAACIREQGPLDREGGPARLDLRELGRGTTDAAPAVPASRAAEPAGAR